MRSIHVYMYCGMSLIIRFIQTVDARQTTRLTAPYLGQNYQIQDGPGMTNTQTEYLVLWMPRGENGSPGPRKSRKLCKEDNDYVPAFLEENTTYCN